MPVGYRQLLAACPDPGCSGGLLSAIIISLQSRFIHDKITEMCVAGGCRRRTHGLAGSAFVPGTRTSSLIKQQITGTNFPKKTTLKAISFPAGFFHGKHRLLVPNPVPDLAPSGCQCRDAPGNTDYFPCCLRPPVGLRPNPGWPVGSSFFARNSPF